MITAPRRLAARQDSALVTFGEEAVAWAADGLRPCYLDPISRLLYSVMDGQVEEAELVDDVADIFDVDSQTANEQVRSIVRHLDDHRLLEREESLAVPGSEELIDDGFLRRPGDG